MKDFLPHISASIDDVLRSLPGLTPELILVAAFILVIISDLFLSRKLPQASFLVALAGLALSTAHVAFNLDVEPGALFGDMLQQSRYSQLFKLLFGISGILFILFIRLNKRLSTHSKGTGDLFAILMAVQLGLNLMAMSGNLLMVYLSLEMVSVGSYVMVGYLSDNARQSEAAMKYALFGAVSSAIMLYGISLVYGFTGTLVLSDPALLSGLAALPPLSAALATGMVFAGICFKLSLVPFHFWAPDVYEGAATPVTAFLSTAPKLAGFALLINFLEVFKGSGRIANGLPVDDVLMILAIAGMVAGNFGAIWQNNVKRMLAYSSIGHTGFMLMALLSFNENGVSALFFYMLIYVIMNMAAFMIADEVEEKTGITEISEYKGMGKVYPFQMILMVIVLVSLTGIPPTAGFTAKFLVFSSALEYYGAAESVLALIMIITAAISTVVSLFYYFRIPLNAFLKDAGPVTADKSGSGRLILAGLLTLLLIVLILFPGLVTGLL